MDSLGVNALAVKGLSPATLSAVSALRPVPAPVVPPAQDGSAPGTAVAPLSVQDLTQSLFQRTLQEALLFPVAESATTGASLAQEATASLLAALAAPQAAANASAPPDATTTTTQGPDTGPGTAALTTTLTPTPATAAAPAVASAVTTDLPAVQDSFATSAGLDFALQTALRFGAGVVAQAAPAFQPTDLGAGLVRDPTAVLRLGNLQPHAGGPGPEAFTHPQAQVQRILQTYQPPLATAASGQLDLMA